ncbi:MAG: hypothetical protein ABL898_09850 [Hyphomicrobiaceae bacterium]|nr:hypothetical protein [Hyphomicrobiaceae bacterium]
MPTTRSKVWSGLLAMMAKVGDPAGAVEVGFCVSVRWQLVQRRSAMARPISAVTVRGWADCDWAALEPANRAAATVTARSVRTWNAVRR